MNRQELNLGKLPELTQIVIPSKELVPGAEITLKGPVSVRGCVAKKGKLPNLCIARFKKFAIGKAKIHSFDRTKKEIVISGNIIRPDGLLQKSPKVLSFLDLNYN